MPIQYERISMAVFQETQAKVPLFLPKSNLLDDTEKQTKRELCILNHKDL
jgi:hypothetical protein